MSSKEALKVLSIANVYPSKKFPFRGTFIKKEMDSLEKQGVKITKIVKTTFKKSEYFVFESKIIVHVLLKRNTYDLIHAHYVPHSSFIPALFKRFIKKPLVVTLHGGDLFIDYKKNKLMGFFFNYSVKKSDSIIVRSKEMAEALNKLNITHPKKIHIVPAGVDIHLFRPKSKKACRRILYLPPDKKIVLFVGRIIKRKGVKYIYECSKKMPDVLFVLVGHGVLKENLLNVLFPGPKPASDIPCWMSAADVFLLPSRVEGLPNVLMEAMACGVPIVASNIGGNNEIVRDGYNGFLFEFGNMEEMCEKIRKILENEDLAKELSKNGRAVATSEYSLEKQISKIKKIYVDLAKKS